MFSFSSFRLDVRDERLWDDGRELKLRRKPFTILKYLVEHPQRLVTHEELVTAVWGKVVVSESLLRTHLHDLRQAVGDKVVETVPGRGYRFLPELHHGEFTGGSNERSGELVHSLVARDTELESLLEALKDARGQRRRVVFLTGDAGVGKTTLLDAFVERARAQGPLWIARGASVEQYGSGEAYLPVLEAIGGLLRGHDGERTADLLSRHAPSWLVQMPGLVSDARLEDAARRASGATQARMLRELAEALDAMGAETPIVLALEDLQWSDPSTADLIALLSHRLQPARVLIIGTYRPGTLPRQHLLTRVVAELAAHRLALQMQLQSFDERALSAYLALRYSVNRFPPRLAPSIHRTTGGNPLFTATLLDDLEVRQAIQQQDDRWVLTDSVDEVASRRPESIRRLIDTQLDRLDPSEQRILEVASVAGVSFTAGLVAHVLEAEPEDVDSTCETLASDRRLLKYVGTEVWPDGTIQSRYGFPHALFQHAAIARTSSASLRSWHRRIAERLEQGYGERQEEIASELAEHYDEARVCSKALSLRATAGERAFKRHGYAEALGHFRRGRQLLPSMPEGRARDELELRILLGLGQSQFLVEGVNTTESVPAYERAVDLSRALGDEGSLCSALAGRLHDRLLQGELVRASSGVDELLTVAGRVADPSLRAAGLFPAAVVDFLRGRFVAARRTLEQIATVSANEHGVAPQPVVAALSVFTQLAWITGHPDEALGVAEGARTLAERLGDPFTVCAAYVMLANLYVWRREPERAVEHARRALELAEKEQLALWRTRAASFLQRGASELDPSLRPEEAAGNAWGANQGGSTLLSIAFIEQRLRVGDLARAEEELQNALSLVEASDERCVEPDLHRLRGQLLERTDPGAAERCYEHAIEIARAQGSLSFELRATLNWYRLASGQKRQWAREALSGVFAKFREGFGTGDLVEARRVLDSADAF